MANTVTQRTLVGGGDSKKVIRMIHIVSDGTEESNLVVFDNSAFCADVSKGKLTRLWTSGDAGIIRLSWDQTADSPAFALFPAGPDYVDFTCFGGITNPNGTGATGDLLLTSNDLDAGDEITIIIEIDQS